MFTISQKNKNVFYKIVSKLVPPATSKIIRNRTTLVLMTFKNYVFFCYRFFTHLLENDTLFWTSPDQILGSFLVFFFYCGADWQFVVILCFFLWYLWCVFLQLLVLGMNPECKNYGVRRWTAAGVFNDLIELNTIQSKLIWFYQFLHTL